MLTGARLREIANAQWQEVQGDVLALSAGRVKNAEPHAIPLAKAALEIVNSLPKFTGPFLLSTTGGQRPISGYSKLKTRLDKEIAALNGGAPIASWRVHDLRRTTRTRLAALGVPHVVAELVIGHRQRGVIATYDRHAYMPEMRSALEKWEAALRVIVYGLPDNVTPLPIKARAEGAETPPKRLNERLNAG